MRTGMGDDGATFDAAGRVSPALRFYFLFRLGLAAGLALLFFSGQGPSVLGHSDRQLFAATVVVYLFLVTGAGLALSLHLGSEERQVQAMAAVDIAAFALLMQASGGAASGLGLLNALTIAVSSLAMGGRQALFYAALATLAALGVEAWADLTGAPRATAYTHAGLLGTAYFAIALLAHQLSRRLDETERLASARGVDLASLQQVSEHVIRQMQTGVLVLDGEARIRLVNAAARALLGLPELAPGQALATACPPLGALLTDRPAGAEGGVTGFRSGPGGRSLRVRATRLGEAPASGTLLLLDDEAALAEQAQRMKLASLGQLTASIAHEIRNPLGAIGHAVQLLDESPAFDEAERQLAGIIRNNVQRVNEVIENVLQLSRRDRARPEPIQLAPWVRRLAEELRRAHHLALEQVTVRVAPEDATAVTDPRQTGQVLAILLENAVTHHAGGHEGLRISVDGGEAADGTLFLDVADNGPGIPEEARARIFEPFFSTRHHGTGLGLYIARELSEACGVRLEHVPAAGDGCRFRLSFPDPRLLA
jgi:two-component system sensor histidine kinase PilS (NtrC family)